MQKEKSHFDVLARIDQEKKVRNWTDYALAKNSNIPQSTISSWYRKDIIPSIASIEKICDGFGMTLSEFFYLPTDDSGDIRSEEELSLYRIWSRLNKKQRFVVNELLKTMDETQG